MRLELGTETARKPLTRRPALRSLDFVCESNDCDLCVLGAMIPMRQLVLNGNILSARNRHVVGESPIRAVQELALKAPRMVSEVDLLQVSMLYGAK